MAMMDYGAIAWKNGKLISTDKTRRGRVGKQVSQTLTTSGGNEMTVVVDE